MIFLFFIPKKLHVNANELPLIIKLNESLKNCYPNNTISLVLAYIQYGSSTCVFDLPTYLPGFSFPASAPAFPFHTICKQDVVVFGAGGR